MADSAKKHAGSQARKWTRPVKGNGKKACTVEGCKHAYRAKGYCWFHYGHWRKGELGHSRYTPCIAEKCTKRPAKDRLCQTHWDEKHAKKSA